MKKLLSSPVKMSLSSAENQIYQNALKFISPLSLNLMAVKVTHHPSDFLGWCIELNHLCTESLNMDLMDEEQLLPLKKLQETLETGVSISQFKMARIAPWPIFVDYIQQQSNHHALDERLRLLSHIETIKETPLADLIIEDKLAFAGKHTSQHEPSLYNFDVEWFASTKGAKAFHTLLELSPEKFDEALANIPLTGEVTQKNYQDFVDAYNVIFNQYSEAENTSHKAPLSAATRLLSMRRPDQFIALNNNKIDTLCKGLSIPKLKNTDFIPYWHDVIGTLRTFSWWNQPEPKATTLNKLTTNNDNENIASDILSDLITEEKSTVVSETSENCTIKTYCEYNLWKNRAILIDLFLFANAEFADSSNYIKALNKALNKQSNATKVIPRKRSKESAEILVDRALSCEELPEYLLGKRDTILKQVKDGKSVEQAINLIRAIFG